MKLKSKNTKGKKRAAMYVRRTLHDERVHRHLSDAAEGLRKAYSRAARQPGARAIKDKKLYDDVGAAAASIGAALRIVRRPEPKPPKRLKRKVVTVALLVGPAAFAAKKIAARRGGDGVRDYSAARPVEPVEPARTPYAA